jgi:hypothetical protein
VNAKRVLTPVLMLAVCVVILASYKVAAVRKTASSPTAVPALQPSPTLPSQPTATAAAPQAQESPSSIPGVGDIAPDFTLLSVWEDTVTLSSYRGESNMVLLFYRTGG